MFETLKSNLEKKGYAVSVFATGDEAVEYLVGAITETTVAFGGSKTLDELGLFERLDQYTVTNYDNISMALARSRGLERARRPQKRPRRERLSGVRERGCGDGRDRQYRRERKPRRGDMLWA